MYQHIRLNSVAQKLFYLQYMMRRIAFVATSFYLHDPVIFQLYSIWFLNLLSLMHEGHAMAPKVPSQRRLELFNELAVCFCSITICIFTDYTSSSTEQFERSWVLFWAICFFLLVNLLFVLHATYETLQLVCKKLYKRFRRCTGMDKNDKKNRDELDANSSSVSIES